MKINPDIAVVWGELMLRRLRKQMEEPMCNPDALCGKEPPQPPECTLARLLERDLSLPHGNVDSVALRLFIKARWSTLTALAHAIHNDG